MRQLRFALLWTLVLLACAPGAYGFHVPPWDTGHQSFDPNDPDNDTDEDDKGPNPCASPVAVASGNFMHSLRLLALNSYGPPIVLALNYNSRDMRKGPFGNGWVHP